jgi:hypothetical protein
MQPVGCQTAEPLNGSPVGTLVPDLGRSRACSDRCVTPITVVM